MNMREQLLKYVGQKVQVVPGDSGGLWVYIQNASDYPILKEVGTDCFSVGENAIFAIAHVSSLFLVN